jgi:hypothetical protein
MDYIKNIEGAEEASNAFIDLQIAQVQMYKDIKKTFLEDEQKRFYKFWTAKKKDELRREVRLDMAEENERAMKGKAMELRVQIESEYADELVKVNAELKKAKEELKVEREKKEKLEDELKGLRSGGEVVEKDVPGEED